MMSCPREYGTIPFFLLSFGFFEIQAITSSFAAQTEMETRFTCLDERTAVTEQKPVSPPMSFFGIFSPETTPVELLSSGIRYCVPRNFLDSVLINKNDMSVSFTAVATFPQFVGVTSVVGDKDGVFAGQKLISPYADARIIRMTSIDSPFSTEHDPNTIVFKAETKTPRAPWRFGLYRSNARSMVGQEVYFSPPHDDFAGFVAFCSTYDSICSSYLRLSQQAVIIIQFNKENIEHWRHVYDGSIKLIRNWMNTTGGAK